jgi:RNA polymerase sigma-70 factor (ECF subfamily)
VPAEEDAGLIRAAAAGDRRAFGHLVDRHEAAVHRYARSLCRTDAEAEDALQQGFLDAWQGAASWRGETSVRGWLFTLTRNAAFRQHRRKVGEPSTLDDLAALGEQAGFGSEDPEVLTERAEVQAQVRAAIEALDPVDREVLVLRDIEDLSAVEAAAILGIEVGALKSRLHRARLKLTARLVALVGGDPCKSA